MSNYVSFSGGKDSTALAVYLKQQGVDYKLVFADTGAEFPETYWTVTNVARQLDKELIIIPTPGFASRLVGWGYLLPSVMRRWCTRELKQAPMDKFFKPEDTVFVGITADESHRLEGIKRPYDLQRPLVDGDISDREAGELCGDMLNPIYAWRSSCSCFCCPFQRQRDWYGLLRNHPQLFRAAEIWEDESIARSETNFGWVKGKRLRDMRERYQAQGQLFITDEPCADEPCAWCAY